MAFHMAFNCTIKKETIIKNLLSLMLYDLEETPKKISVSKK